jgi:N-acetyl-gamma-glutamylphosphate reductase
MSEERLKIALVGASGYGGGELLRLLLNHKSVLQSLVGLQVNMYSEPTPISETEQI